MVRLGSLGSALLGEIASMEMRYAQLTDLQKKILEIFLISRNPETEYSVRLKLYYASIKPFVYPSRFISEIEKSKKKTKEMVLKEKKAKEWENKIEKLTLAQKEKEFRKIARQHSVSLPSNRKIKSFLEDLSKRDFLQKTFSGKEKVADKTGLKFVIHPKFFNLWFKTAPKIQEIMNSTGNKDSFVFVPFSNLWFLKEKKSEFE